MGQRFRGVRRLLSLYGMTMNDTIRLGLFLTIATVFATTNAACVRTPLARFPTHARSQNFDAVRPLLSEAFEGGNSGVTVLRIEQRGHIGVTRHRYTHELTHQSVDAWVAWRRHESCHVQGILFQRGRVREVDDWAPAFTIRGTTYGRQAIACDAAQAQ